MPLTFNIPKPKKTDKDSGEVCCEPDYSWRSRSHLPASKEMVQNTNVGDEVTIILKGKVFSTESRQSEYDEGEDIKDWNEIGIKIDTITLDEKNEFEKLSEDD